MPLDERERAELQALRNLKARLTRWADGENFGKDALSGGSTATAADLASALARLQALIRESR
jgi:hypothetical protein